MQWNWAVTYPINIYNITLNIGKYTHFSDTLHGENGLLDLDYFVLEYNLDKAKEQFKQVKPMLRIFEYWMGPYPFYKDGYKLVETFYLGMEHQSAIAYGNQYKNGYLGRDYSGSGWGKDWDYIIIHESGHEWFGNHLSCKDVADLWLHEGFTTYTEALYVSSVYGSKASQEYIQSHHSSIQNDVPLLGDYNVKKEGSSDMYSKGAALIHMIRTLVQNDSLFREILRKMQATYGMKQTTSTEIENFLSRESGLSLKGMFDQYLRTIQIPALEYRIKKEKGRFVLYYKWSNCIPKLEMPILLPLRNGQYQTQKATTSWKSLSTDFSSAEEIEKQLNPNFYVVYKKSL
jgi:aminopeptidase N